VDPNRPILLTGASGLIGGLVGRAVLAAGRPLRVLVHRRRATWIPEGVAVEERHGDVLDPATLHGVADGCAAVVHAAARPGFAALDRRGQERVNVGGTRVMLREARSSAVPAFVLIGDTGTIQERGGDAAVEETTPPAMQYESAYVRQKLDAETATLEANRPGVLRAMVVSPGALAGAGCDSLLSGLARLYLRRDLPFRLFEDVWLAITGTEDVGACVLAALERGKGGRRYFATGETLRLRDFFRLLESQSGVAPPRRRIPDLLAEELGGIAPLLPPRSFLRRLILPRELALHLRRLAPARSDRTRREIGFVPQPIDAIVQELVQEERALPRGGRARPSP
jgi:dihydroflavonol-4-reductase